jgi:hypothetical protein
VGTEGRPGCQKPYENDPKPTPADRRECCRHDPKEEQMKKNMGTPDRLIRIALALVVAFLYFTGRIGGALAIILGIVALVFLLTSLAGHCPAYSPLGISTCRRAPDSRAD